MVWWFLQSKVWIFLVHKLIGGNVLRNPPIKSLNICCSQIDWRKCSDDSSNQQFVYLSCTNWLEEISWWFLHSKFWILLVPKLIGGNALKNPPIKNLNMFCSQMVWRKCSGECFVKSSDEKFEYLLEPNRLEEMLRWFFQWKIWIVLVDKLIGGNVLMIPPIKILNILGAQID